MPRPITSPDCLLPHTMFILLTVRTPPSAAHLWKANVWFAPLSDMKPDRPRPRTSPPTRISTPSAEPVPSASLPIQWFRKPLDESIKMVIRPHTALTRRKEVSILHQVPREVFEDFMTPLKEEDAEGLERDPETGKLLPTKTRPTYQKFEYNIKRGSVSDKLFHLHTLDPDPIPPKRLAPSLAQIGEDGVYEVEAICGKRKVKSRTQYQVKWMGFPEEMNTWQSKSSIDPAMVAAFEGKTFKRQRVAAPSRPMRGAGAARARLSTAAERRGEVPQTISMVCGNVKVLYKESVPYEKKMPTLKLVFFVLTMDKTGHVTWPVNFSPNTRAALRLQARTLLRQMIDDPLSPVDCTMEPALTGKGTDSIFKEAPKCQFLPLLPVQQ